LLKKFFQSTILFDNDRVDNIMKLSLISEIEEKIKELELFFKSNLSPEDLVTLSYLFNLLHDISRKKDLNLMSSTALSTHWSPLLLRDNGEGAGIIESIIDHCDFIFGRLKLRKMINEVLDKKKQNTNIKNLDIQGLNFPTKGRSKHSNSIDLTVSPLKDNNNNDLGTIGEDEEEEQIPWYSKSELQSKINKKVRSARNGKKKKRSSESREKTLDENDELFL